MTIQRVRSHRAVTDLMDAKPCGVPPHARGKTRQRGAKAAGLRYERAVAKALPGTIHGQWFSFYDANGHGYCQPDLILPLKELVLVLECKLTDTVAARSQLEYLYRPVLEFVYQRKVLGIVVTRHLTKISQLDDVVDSFEQAVVKAQTGIPTLHWLGRGAI